MTDDRDYGPRLDQPAYQRAVVELHERGARLPAAERAEALRAGELELTIDHRLGRDYPAPQRARLQALHRELQQRQERLTKELDGGSLTPVAFADAMDALIAWFGAELEARLGPRERAALLGGATTLGLDPAKIDRG